MNETSEFTSKNSLFSSYGAQPKFKLQNTWVKEDYNGTEGLSEVIVSILLSNTKNVNFLKYSLYSYDNRRGCISDEILESEEELITFRTLLGGVFGLVDILESIEDLSLRDKLQLLIYRINYITKLDITKYFCDTCSLDIITLNDDRHFSNLAVIRKNNEYKIAPIFDNGSSLLSLYKVYGYLSNDEGERELVARPIPSTFEEFKNAVIELDNYKPLQINYRNLINDLKDISEIIYNKVEIDNAVNLLLLRLNKYRGVLWYEVNY